MLVFIHYKFHFKLEKNRFAQNTLVFVKHTPKTIFLVALSYILILLLMITFFSLKVCHTLGLKTPTFSLPVL